MRILGSLAMYQG